MSRAKQGLSRAALPGAALVFDPLPSVQCACYPEAGSIQPDEGHHLCYRRTGAAKPKSSRLWGMPASAGRSAARGHQQGGAGRRLSRRGRSENQPLEPTRDAGAFFVREANPGGSALSRHPEASFFQPNEGHHLCYRRTGVAKPKSFRLWGTPASAGRSAARGHQQGGAGHRLSRRGRSENQPLKRRGGGCLQVGIKVTLGAVWASECENRRLALSVTWSPALSCRMKRIIFFPCRMDALP